jgi:hypothetical protein
MYLDVVAPLDPTLELRPGQSPPLEKFVLAGTREEVGRQAAALHDAGVHRIEFGNPHGPALRLGRVVPELRASG